VTEIDTHDSDGPTPPYEEHIGASRQYVRDIILGVNDGLISTFLLVSGVVGGGLTSTQVLLTGIAGGVAGMISMAAGEYMATKSQEEVFEAEMELEKHHLLHHRDHERAELREMFEDMGLHGEDLDTVVDIIDKSDESMLGVMAGLEFGVVDTERRSPYVAALASGLFFLIGALPSVLPFAFLDDPTAGLLVAGVLSGIGLFIVGAVKTTLTKKNAIISGAENLAIGLGGGLLSYLVGKAFDQLIA
jgi:predicted membrane protein (TIGR00267 family)